ncbi:hypothetical protein LTR53_006172 [Teratosphaeriaceae sp. CCFEE 6253]|nr:hypothetical protein LTR53_006172 [Teratosphaeriaceae sp. CCFEE 6253]
MEASMARVNAAAAGVDGKDGARGARICGGVVGGVDPIQVVRTASELTLRPIEQPSTNSYQLAPTSPPRTLTGHKRKLDALRPPARESAPDARAAPAVPSFGAPILPSKPTRTVAKALHPYKAGPNALGLTPGSGDQVYPSSDEDDDEDDGEMDEEALHAELGDKLTFEHNGAVLSLTSAADLLAWRNERKRQWPTKARMSEREVERQRIGEERKRLLGSTARTHRPRAEAREPRQGRTERLRQSCQDTEASKANLQPHPAKAETELEKAKRQLKAQEAQVAALRKHVSNGQSVLDAARAQLVEQDELHAEQQMKELAQQDGESNAESSVLSDSSVFSSDTGSEPDIDTDDDDKPDELPSKQELPGKTVRPTPLCRYFAASGRCREGEACLYRHEFTTEEAARQQPAQQVQSKHAAPRLDPTKDADRKSIYQRLLEQQGEEEDRLALQVIKYLGKAGFFKADDAGV